MFWTDWVAGPRKGNINVAYMDGTERRSFLDEDMHQPSGLAVDVKLGKLYWTDRALQRLESINIDGTGRKIELGNEMNFYHCITHSLYFMFLLIFLLFSDRGLGQPVKLVLGPDKTFYFLDKSGEVFSYKPETGRKSVYYSGSSQQDITIFDTNRVSHVILPECTRCPGLCLRTANGNLTCVCRDGYTLSEDKFSCLKIVNYTKPSACAKVRFFVI